MDRSLLFRLGFPGLLLALASGCATTDFVTGKDVQNMYSIDEEIQLGREFYVETVKELKKEKAPIDQDPARVAFVRDVTEHIVAVAAHEIAHVNCRHSTEAMTREMLPNLLLAGAAIWAEIEDEEEAQLILGGAMLAYNGLVVTKYSRVDELEADRVGMMYMAQAGYDPAAAPRVWERLAGATDSQLEKTLSIFSTHPRDYLRAQELRKHLPEAQALYEDAPVKRDGSRKLSDLPPLQNKKPAAPKTKKKTSGS